MFLKIQIEKKFHKYLQNVSPEQIYLRQNHFDLRSLNVFATDNLRKNILSNGTISEQINYGKHYLVK